MVKNKRYPGAISSQEKSGFVTFTTQNGCDSAMWKEHYPVAHQICWLCDTASHSLLQLDDQIHRYQPLKVVGTTGKARHSVHSTTKREGTDRWNYSRSIKNGLAETTGKQHRSIYMPREKAITLQHFNTIKLPRSICYPKAVNARDKTIKHTTLNYTLITLKRISEVVCPFMTADFGSLSECRKIRIHTNHSKISTLVYLEI